MLRVHRPRPALTASALAPAGSATPSSPTTFEALDRPPEEGQQRFGQVRSWRSSMRESRNEEGRQVQSAGVLCRTRPVAQTKNRPPAWARRPAVKVVRDVRAAVALNRWTVFARQSANGCQRSEPSFFQPPPAEEGVRAVPASTAPERCRRCGLAADPHSSSWSRG